MSTENNETMDTSQVYTMFEDVKKLLTSLLKMQQKQTMAASASEPTPALTPADGEKIETLTEKLDRVGKQLDLPLRHHHTLDFMGNRALIAWAAVALGLIASLFIIEYQQRTLSRFRDNDLKYRYIQMKGEATSEDILQLRNAFEFTPNPDSIKLIRRQVERYEQLIRQQAENEARARLNASAAERLQNQAETVKGGK